MFSRKELHEELYLRQQIRESIAKKFLNKDEELLKEFIEDVQLRDAIRQMISEDVENTPHRNTGLNELEKLLKKIIPVLEQDFKTLTSGKEQRESFRAHIVKAVQNLLLPEIGMEKGDLSEDVDVKVGEDSDDRI